MFDRALVLARFTALDPQHRCELVGIGVEPARTVGDVKPGSTLSARRYLRTVLRERPVRRDISRIEQ